MLLGTSRRGGVQPCSAKDSDEGILYIDVKEQFTQTDDMVGSVAKVRMSPPSSINHSYQCMSKAVGARRKTTRLDIQEAEIFAAYKPDLFNAITAGRQNDKCTSRG